MSVGEEEEAEVGEGGDSSIGCKGLEEDIDFISILWTKDVAGDDLFYAHVAEVKAQGWDDDVDFSPGKS